ncbi:hypothetical protein [Pseudomonas citronellolis]|uniref:hypothetical protein n=1 Tax=Pseudomonas citronellolis TaxID=53408 RepID=UPI0012FE090D|nr:hypothetical protein [Pseudomonas citronellolis]
MNPIKFLLKIFRQERPACLFPYLPENPSIIKGNEQFNSYPPKSFLGSQGNYAYYVVMVLGHEELPELLTLIKSRFSATESINESILSNENQESLALSYRDEFGGILVEATTNSISLLQSFDERFMCPPAPWIAFPDMAPIEASLPKQGNLEYWWDHIWTPFWTSQSASEKEQYLHNATEEWREVLS